MATYGSRKLGELGTGGPGTGVRPVGLSGPVYRGGEGRHQKRVTIGPLASWTSRPRKAQRGKLWVTVPEYDVACPDGDSNGSPKRKGVAWARLIGLSPGMQGRQV